MDQAREFLTHFSGPAGYLTFYVVLMACGMGLPWNSDITIITASVLAALGYFDIKILFVLALVALLSGDAVTFTLGRRYGKTLLRKRPFRWFLKEEQIAIAELYISQRGEKFVFFIRFFPFIRTVLYFTSGSLRVRPKIFFLCDALASLIYLPLVMTAAYTAGENINAVFATLKKFQLALLGVAILILVLIVSFKKIQKFRRKGILLA